MGCCGSAPWRARQPVDCRRSGALSREYPAVRVELATNTTDALVEGVWCRKLEAAFVAGRVEAVGLEALVAFDEELVIIAPRSHPTIGCAQDVRTDTVISFPSGCAYRRLLQTWLAASAVVPEKVLELSSYHAIVALCRPQDWHCARAPALGCESLRCVQVTVSPCIL